MKVCEMCSALGYAERLHHGQRIKVLCGCCLGVGSLSLGHESAAHWRQLREQAIARAIREGWYEEAWHGEPGQAKKVLVLVGPAELVQRSA